METGTVLRLAASVLLAIGGLFLTRTHMELSSDQLGVLVFAGAVLFGVLWIIVAAVVMLRRGYRPARLFLLAWSLFLFGTAAFTLLAFGVLPRNFWTHNGVQIGSALEMLLLSLALGARYAGLDSFACR